jgi:hypothetical protein
MKLSKVINKFLITTWDEGIHLVTWDHHDSDEDLTLTCSYTDEQFCEYSAEFEDQEIVFNDSPGLFVVQCDGQPWQFKAWDSALLPSDSFNCELYGEEKP